MKTQKHTARTKRFPQAFWIGVFTIAAAVVAVPMAGHGLWLQNSSSQIPAAVNRIPDNNQAHEINGQQDQKQSLEAANALRKKQIADETEKLLQLATDLKSEVDKTSKDTLSINVIRKADAIEKLARDVKQKMKLSVGGS
jgi:cytochrome c-type biogenesis protein CcmH/NrfG